MGAVPNPAAPDRLAADRADAGRRLALLTQHDKERVIAPALESALGCRVERVAGDDIDRLGAPTRETRPLQGAVFADPERCDLCNP